MAIQVKRETMRACLSCTLCDNILRDATTISECLHTFCKKCIYEKITEDEMECCPVCNIELRGAPLEKLRSDYRLQDLRAKIFPLKRRKVNAPEIVSSLLGRRKERSISALVLSIPKVSAQAGTTRRRSKGVTRKDLRGNDSLAERTMRKAESSFCEELMSGEPEDIVAFGKLAQENKELRHTVSVVSDALMASNESLKKLSAEKKSADVRLGEMEELKSLLAARDRELEAKEKELEAGSLLIRAREDEVCSLGARVESLHRERDEAEEKADRLGKELQECKSKGRFEDGSSASEELKHMCYEFAELEKDMELAVIAACITTRYQVCREWESQGTLRWELEFSAEDYHKFREFVDKNGTSYKYPRLEVYEEKWKRFVACHRPSESHSTLDRENISSDE
uniref:E3 ubiquitin protein ligase DRIP1 n=2 Tax=Noccaea caerulescens TaxID=107243 RepID=A0A1J3H7X9_NOCCA